MHAFTKQNIVIEKAEKNEVFLFYKNMYSFLIPAFPPIELLTLQRLERASLLFFNCLLSFDNAIDSPRSPDFIKNIRDGFFLHEKTVIELTTIFTKESPFWKSFDFIKEQYFLILQREYDLTIKDETLSYETFCKLAEGKSIFCLAAITALCILTNDYSNEDSLKNSILKLHLGFQLLDDINDFPNDIKSCQPNLAVSLVRNYIRQNDISVLPNDSVSYHKLLFISGIANNVLEDCIRTFEQAISIIKELPLNGYKEYIYNKIKKCRQTIFSIDQSLLKSEQKKQLSSVKISHQQNLAFNKGLSSAIELADNFLYSQLDEYLWYDFLTSMGQSSFWITGYVGFNLSENNCSNNLLEKVAAKLSKINYASYNDKMIQDADSSSFYISFLSRYNIPV